MDLLAGYGSDSSLDSSNKDDSERSIEVPNSPVVSNITENITSITNIDFKENENSEAGAIEISIEKENIEDSAEAASENSVVEEIVLDKITTSSTPLLVEEAQRRKEEEYTEISSHIEIKDTICLSSEYGEHGTRAKFIAANSAHMLGRTIDEHAITIGRKTVIEKDVILRGDLEAIQVGQTCYLGARTVLRPPWRIDFEENKRKCVWSKMVIGSYVHCGRDCVVQSFAIGSFVRIGDGCILGKHTVIKDCCLICPGSILPDYMVVPPFAVVKGAPARIVGELPESTLEEYRTLAERNCRSRIFSSAPDRRT